MDLWQILNWFSGGANQYRTLFHCMSQDMLWIGITVALDIAVATGYSVIAFHWWKNQRTLPNDSPARQALGNMRNIFVFCGICGYLFIPVKMFWPAWRLYDFFMAGLAYYTWKYAWDARDLKVVYSELNKSQQLAADLQASREESKRKSFFLNAISHDLRTPLNGLSLQASLAEVAAEDNNPQSLRQALTEIRASASAAAGLLDSLLECARLDWSADENVIKEMDLEDVLQQLVERFDADARQKGLYLRYNLAGKLVVCTDRVKLDRILGNLVANAIKFTTTGGVTLSAQESHDGIVIEVADTGEGIAPEHQALLFEEFFQVHNSERDRTKGFGLGLAIAKRLAQQIGAQLRIASTLGQGSSFTVAIPRVAAAKHGEDEPAGSHRTDELPAEAAPAVG